MSQRHGLQLRPWLIRNSWPPCNVRSTSLRVVLFRPRRRFRPVRRLRHRRRAFSQLLPILLLLWIRRRGRRLRRLASPPLLGRFCRPYRLSTWVALLLVPTHAPTRRLAPVLMASRALLRRTWHVPLWLSL